MIYFSIINNSVVYYFKIILRKFIYKFLRTMLALLTIAISLIRSIKRYISRKYISLLVYSIINLILTNLLSYIRLKKSTLLKFYRKLLFLFVIITNLRGFNILRISKVSKTSKDSRYNEFSIIY